MSWKFNDRIKKSEIAMNKTLKILNKYKISYALWGYENLKSFNNFLRRGSVFSRFT